MLGLDDAMKLAHSMKESDTASVNTSADYNSSRQGTPAGRAPAVAVLELVDVLSSNRRWLIWVAVISLLGSSLIAFLIPKRYETAARLMPPDETTGMSGMALAALTSKVGDAGGAIAGDVLGLRTTGATLIGILTSRTVQDDIINQFDLRRVYSKKNYEDARKVLQSRTSVAEDKKSGIITIAVQDRDPERAVQIAKAYIAELNRRVAQFSTSSARREREFLEQRLIGVKQDLDESSLRLSEFSSRNKTLDPQLEGKAMLEAASNLQGQVIAAETELSGLQQVYGPENARVRSANARVGELKAKMRRLAGTSDAGKSAGSGEPYPSLGELPMLGNTYYQLYRKTKIDETIYEALMRQYELAKVQEAKDIPSIKVLDEPELPEKKAWPPRLVIILLGTVLGSAAGITWCFGKRWFTGLAEDDPLRIVLTHVGGGVNLAGRRYSSDHSADSSAG